MRKIIFLGTNGWYDTNTGNTICILLDTPKCYFILDAGNGLHKIDKYIIDPKPIYLLLSHYHLDHIIGFHFLFRFDFKQGIKILGQNGIKNDLNKILCPPYTISLSDYKYPIGVYEFDELKNELSYKVDMFYLKHSKSCVGYRFNINGEIISYCADTGYCENAILLAKDADIIIAECSFKKVINKDDSPHLDPFLAATLAKEANAKKLYLIHFDASLYTELNDRLEAEKLAKTIFQESYTTFDDMII